MKQHFFIRHRNGLLATAMLLMTCISCVSIKPSTVQLSAEVGERISEMQGIHQLALQRYFDMEKQKVETFLTEKWEPLFLRNFLGTSRVLPMLQNVAKIDDKGRAAIREAIALYLVDKKEADKAAKELVDKVSDSRRGEDGVIRTVLTRFVEDNQVDAAVIHVSSLLGTDEPARIIFDFAEAAHKQMLAQRNEMLAPIEQARAEAMAALAEGYSELIRGQSTITGRLEAAAKRSRQQDELLDKLKLRISDDVVNRMAGFSAQVNQALSAANAIIEKRKEGGSGDIISTIRDGLQTKPANKN